ncbi:MAG: hypothetical protein DRH12_17120 [Deltaproteobacteria bacterium]|nr:MAG: hypothetical protein DRH12_17120 [Deltaproteobacteria bacterium]
MPERFTIFKDTDKQGNEIYYVGIEITVAGHALKCPLSEGCTSPEMLGSTIALLQHELEELKQKFKSWISPGQRSEGLDFPPGTPPEKIWNTLSEIKNEESFVDGFNSLSEEQRKDVAEYVLTHCNVFSGKAAVFSARYNSKSGLME